MPITLECPSGTCRKRLVAKDELAGRVVKCPKCGQPIHIPAKMISTAPATRGALPSATPQSTSSGSSRNSGLSLLRWRYIAPLVVAVVIESGLVVLHKSQARPGELGVTDLVRTEEIVLGSHGQRLEPVDDTKDCVLHVRVTGVSASDLENQFPDVQLTFANKSREPSVKQMNTSTGTFGPSVSRIWLTFIVPRLQSDYMLVLGSDCRIPFQVSGSIHSIYYHDDSAAEAGFPVIILAVAFPVLCCAVLSVYLLIMFFRWTDRRSTGRLKKWRATVG